MGAKKRSERPLFHTSHQQLPLVYGSSGSVASIHKKQTTRHRALIPVPSPQPPPPLPPTRGSCDLDYGSHFSTVSSYVSSEARTNHESGWRQQIMDLDDDYLPSPKYMKDYYLAYQHKTEAMTRRRTTLATKPLARKLSRRGSRPAAATAGSSVRRRKSIRKTDKKVGSLKSCRSVSEFETLPARTVCNEGGVYQQALKASKSKKANAGSCRCSGNRPCCSQR